MSAAVSLYIPVYNGRKYLERCLHAVQQLTYAVMQVIIVDDASTDGLHEWLSSGELPDTVEVIRLERHSGVAAARNAALGVVRGEFVASIDVDCIVSPDWLSQLMPHFADPAVVGVGGELVEDAGSSLADSWRCVHMSQKPPVRDGRAIFLPGCNTVFRRSALAAVEGYDADRRYHHEDTDICARLSAAGGMFVYDATARVTHVKRDSIRSVLRSCWGFRYPEPIVSMRGLLRAIGFECARGVSLCVRDVSAKRAPLCVIDCLYGFYLTFFLCYAAITKHANFR